MKIAIEGCAHGELEKIYETLEYIEKHEGVKVDLLICCGDFQSTRNVDDLKCMAVPVKYSKICTFYKYYSGEKTAPILTIFIGGNHEASNYLQELAFGGWVAPNIYYLGYASVVNIGGLRIGGLSGIYKTQDYMKGRFEALPYDMSTKRSIYHIRNIDVFRLMQLSGDIDVFLSHDWPRGIHKYGDAEKLLRKKPFFKTDIENNRLGSEPAMELLEYLKPKYWFSAHLHTKFPAIIEHKNTDSVTKTTKFLALDKCLPKRDFLQIVDIECDTNEEIKLKYDIEWITILYLTNHLTSIKSTVQFMPAKGCERRWIFTPTEEEKIAILEKFDNDLTIPNNFLKTAPVYDPDNHSNRHDKRNFSESPGQINPQTKTFCDKLGIQDPMDLVLKHNNITDQSMNLSTTSTATADSFVYFPTTSVDDLKKRLNLSLPEPKLNLTHSPESELNITSPQPNAEAEDLSVYSNMEVTNEKSQENLDDSVSQTIAFSEDACSSSTPKKFKRRNEAIYRTD